MDSAATVDVTAPSQVPMGQSQRGPGQKSQQEIGTITHAAKELTEAELFVKLELNSNKINKDFSLRYRFISTDQV